MTETLAPEVRLGNDIARQFAHLPEAEAVPRIADHLRRFWDPRMRARLHELVAAGAQDLDSRVVLAAALL